MRIAGAEGLDPRFELVLVGHSGGVPTFLQVNAPKIGLRERIRAEIRPPKVPRNGPPARTPGGDFVRNPDQSPVLTENPDDPGYLRALDDRIVLITIGLIYECLDKGKGPHQVEFDAVKGKDEKAADFYARLGAEMTAGGFNMAAIEAVDAAIARLGTITSDEILKARALLEGKDKKGPTPPSSSGE